MTPSLQAAQAARDPNRRRWAFGTAALLASAALTGCIVVPSGRYPNQGPQPSPYPAPQPSPYPGPDGDVVGAAPPAPQVEVVVQAPGPGYFWIAGHWVWHLGRHVWVGGRWEGHRQGYAWVPHSWHRHSRGWRSAPGHWRRH